MRTHKPTPCSRRGLLPLKLLGLVLISIPTASCGTLGIGTTQYLDTSCQAFAPLTYSSSKDSPETVAEIRTHNRVFDALCPAQGAAR